MSRRDTNAYSLAYDRIRTLAGGSREHRYTRRFATLCLGLLALATVACGPKASAKSYQKAVSKQESCCNALADAAARDSCTQRIVRVSDRQVQTANENRATYACVERHFRCDPATGTARQDSAQTQLDCISDLDR